MPFRKSFINPNVVKVFTYAVLAVILTSLVSVSTSRIMNNMMERTEKEYFESYKNNLNGYTKALSVALESYLHALNIFYDEEAFADADATQIQSALGRYSNRLPADIVSVLYITDEGMGYTDKGQLFDMSDRPFYYKDPDDKREFIIGDGFFSRQGNAYAVFPVVIPVKNTEGKIKGSLCAIIPITELKVIFEKDMLLSDGLTTLQDGNQLFLYTPNEQKLMEKPDVQMNDFSKYEGVTLEMLQEYVHFSGHHINGVEYDFFIKNVPGTSWIISVYAPMQVRIDLRKEQRRNKITLIIVMTVIIVLLLLLEVHVLEMLQKRQMLVILYDPLTGFLSKQRFENEANRMLRHNKNQKFIVIDCDIKGFKFINQKYGEKKADELIIYFAELLRKVAAEFKALVTRSFADHFEMIVKIDSVDAGMISFLNKIERLNEAIKQYEIPFFPVFGLAFKTDDSPETDTIQKLVGQASFAKATSKANVLQNYSIYDSNLVEKVKEENFYEEHMEEALANGEFFVVYQPKVNLETDMVEGAEALVRWKSSKIGIVGPDKFIPLFERNGFVTKLDFFVYDQVFKFLQDCKKKGLPMVPVSVNMSRNHAKPEEFMKNFMELFNKYDISPDYVQIEILERSVMDSTDLKVICDLLHREGFSIAMDDFGSGESSLNMLAKIPVDVLKFDREFLLSSTDEFGFMEQQSKDFINTLVSLGQNLRKRTVFEGVETEKQRDFLKSIGCDVAQGYYYSKPLPQEDYLKYVMNKI